LPRTGTVLYGMYCTAPWLLLLLLAAERTVACHLIHPPALPFLSASSSSPWTELLSSASLQTIAQRMTSFSVSLPVLPLFFYTHDTALRGTTITVLHSSCLQLFLHRNSFSICAQPTPDRSSSLPSPINILGRYRIYRGPIQSSLHCNHRAPPTFRLPPPSRCSHPQFHSTKLLRQTHDDSTSYFSVVIIVLADID